MKEAVCQHTVEVASKYNGQRVHLQESEGKKKSRGKEIK